MQAPYRPRPESPIACPPAPRVGGLRAALLAAATTAVVLVLGAGSARAEKGGAPGDDVRAQIKAKMERILKMMRENEDALLRLSSGREAATRKPEIEIPPPQEGAGESGQGADSSGSGGESGRSGAQGGSAGEGNAGAGGPSGSEGGALPGSGREAVRTLDEILKGTEPIPDEIKQLVQMIPT